MEAFQSAYDALNIEQKRAVDTIDGPVMVIAGPGTGKTQVLSLRIANILTKTDTPADGILCLTFTTAGVKAMRERLMRTIGPAALKVRIATFHSFALDIIEEFHTAIGYDVSPILLDDSATVALFDELLYAHEWTYLRPRANPAQYFRDIVSLISMLKRDRISPDAFSMMIEEEMVRLQHDPESISSRGETKGSLKKDVQKKIESLARTKEVSVFYERYEALKRDRSLIDYNDVLELLVHIVEESDEARDTIRERHLYVLVDEHQDSSGIQNEFLVTVWQETERPNLFVVGDDRQLIYGFGGASIDYFKGFTLTFQDVTLITLLTNYRSTQTILDVADTLLESNLAQGKLIANAVDVHPISLVECDYPRDEIIRAGIDIKEKVKGDQTTFDQCAILVPKNRHVKNAIATLRDMGIPVAAQSSLHLFELPETETLLSILRVVGNPFDSVSLARTLFDTTSDIPPLNAHTFLYATDAKKMHVSVLVAYDEPFISAWGKKLSEWINLAQSHDAYATLQIIADECFIVHAADDEGVRRRVEIVRTLLHLALAQSERGEVVTLEQFLIFITRLQDYGQDIPLAVFGRDTGVKVLTLHGSKGLEFDAVWIAHMDERSFVGSKRAAFSLPESLNTLSDEESEAVKKRELYVAMTRARRYLTISYARMSYTGSAQIVASIIASLPEAVFTTEKADVSEQLILGQDTNLFVSRHARPVVDIGTIASVVSETYTKRKVSVTLLNNFFECPWKWYFRSLLQLPEPLSESLYVGNVVHKALEYLLKGNSVSDATIATFAEKETRYDTALAARIVSQVVPIVAQWQQSYPETIVQPFVIEKNYSYRDSDFPHLTITGKIDMVEEVISSEVRVTDWKTGSVKTGSEVEKEDAEGRMSSYLRQLSMYSYLIDGVSAGTTEVTESRLVFLEAKSTDKHAVVSRTITQADIARLKKDIEDYDISLIEGEWIHRPCHAKQYGEHDACVYCAMAEKFGMKKK